jgi:hypothetical protein
LLLADLLVNESKRGQPATVYFQPGVVAGDSRDGVVTKRDRYITVKNDAGEEVFSWDNVRYISEKGAPASNQVERIVDLIDLLSKLGIAATVLFFTVGLFQYRQGQKWEREKFLATPVKEFVEWHRNRTATAMIDSLLSSFRTRKKTKKSFLPTKRFSRLSLQIQLHIRTKECSYKGVLRLLFEL